MEINESRHERKLESLPVSSNPRPLVQARAIVGQFVALRPFPLLRRGEMTLYPRPRMVALRSDTYLRWKERVYRRGGGSGIKFRGSRCVGWVYVLEGAHRPRPAL